MYEARELMVEPGEDGGDCTGKPGGTVGRPGGEDRKPRRGYRRDSRSLW